MVHDQLDVTARKRQNVIRSHPHRTPATHVLNDTPAMERRIADRDHFDGITLDNAYQFRPWMNTELLADFHRDSHLTLVTRMPVLPFLPIKVLHGLFPMSRSPLARQISLLAIKFP